MQQNWHDFVKLYPLVKSPRPGAYTNGNDLAVLLALAAWRKPAKVLEMYAALGHTAANLTLACPQATVYTFDTCKEYGLWPLPGNNWEVPTREHVGREIQTLPADAKARCRLGVHPPDDMYKQIAAHGPYELAWIDGNHSWRGVVEDTRVALDTCEEDAVLVWDDYWAPCPETMAFINIMNGRCADCIVYVANSRVCYCALTRGKYKLLKHAIGDL